MKLCIAIVSVSDRSSKGERADMSRPAIEKCLCDIASFSVYECIPDEKSVIEKTLIDICDNRKAQIVLTTGGTGLAPRDVTPEATLSVGEKLVPGLSEEMRRQSMKFTNKAMLSRAVSVMRNNVLIVNLPGSPKAASECLAIIKPVLCHAAELLAGEVSDCARK